jgi:cob(I)alamin adenosyltransferase
MPKLTRIYTRTGDDGTTGLVGGQRVLKSAPRIECFGTLDELSSVIGVARCELAAVAQSATAPACAARLDAWLAWVQDLLFNLGSELATMPADRWETMPLITAADVTALERGIDEAQAELSPLANFIHPGGSRAGAQLHVARTICRRSERQIVALASTDEVSAPARNWVNRLSDALFVWARWINHGLGEPEALWNAKTAPPASA